MECNEQIKMSGLIRVIKQNVITGVRTIQIFHNLVCTSGKVAIARRLMNSATQSNEGMITYGATGTGNTAPSASDTTLTTELARKVIATAFFTSNVVTLRVFFNTTSSNGNIKEFGLFGEGASGSANTGTMFNHALVTVTKTSAETLTIEAELTIA